MKVVLIVAGTGIMLLLILLIILAGAIINAGRCMIEKEE